MIDRTSILKQVTEQAWQLEETLSQLEKLPEPTILSQHHQSQRFIDESLALIERANVLLHRARRHFHVG